MTRKAHFAYHSHMRNIQNIPKEHFEFLYEHYGTHTKAAKALRLSVRAYRDFRKEGCAAPVIARAVELLVDKLKKEAA